jgi:hypothetical protein
MLYDDTQSAPTAATARFSSPREMEFRQALDQYLASHAAEQRRRRQLASHGGLVRRSLRAASEFYAAFRSMPSPS